MADTNTFSASAVGLMMAGAKPASQPHQSDIARSTSLPDGGVKDGDDGEGGGELNVNHRVSRVALSPHAPAAYRPPAAAIHVG
jgi:hypothetical protein